MPSLAFQHCCRMGSVHCKLHWVSGVSVTDTGTFADEPDIVKQVKGFGGRLQQCDQRRVLLEARHVPQELCDCKGGGAVKAC